MEGIKHQQRVLEFFSCSFTQLCIIQQIHQGCDVVAAKHGAQQFDSVFLINQGGFYFTLGQRGQKTGFYISGLVNTGRYTVADQVQNEFFFACRWVFQQFNQFGNLGCIQWFGHNAQFSPFGHVLAICF